MKTCVKKFDEDKKIFWKEINRGKKSESGRVVGLNEANGPTTLEGDDMRKSWALYMNI